MKQSIFSLEGKVALVTGASGAIGMDISISLAQAGADIVAVGRNTNRLLEATEMVEKCGRESLIISADLTKMEDIRRIEKESIDRFNHVDILINNAAVSLLKKVDNFTEDDFDLIMNTNLKGSFFLSQLIANKMKRNNGGNIIFITSSLGKTAMSATGLYGASKAALMQITRSMALEWAEHNIRVNSVSPGPWATGMLEPLFRDMRKMKEALSRLTPARRLGGEGDIGGAVIFLTSEASRHITGQDLIVDGGFSICKII